VTEVTRQFTGVGKTAIFVAMMRRQESERADALFRDPFAQAMLDALADDPALPEVADVIRRHGFPEYFAVRTRFFDEAVLAAMRSGIRQIVTLGAGMDGRTLRLECPADVRWFELDMPEMTVVKDAFIACSALSPTCERYSVGADLTLDWPTALREAGFDSGQPTVWLVEGLLMYLTDPEGDALLADVTALSAPGSRLTLEHLQPMMLGDNGECLRGPIESLGTSWRSAREDLQPWLAGHGWNAHVYAGTDPQISHGRTVGRLPGSWLASGTLASPST
jgi:methyltransferase (TIGR00027 family)